MPATATPFRLPSIMHAGTLGRHQQVLRSAEESVAAIEDPAAMLCHSQVDQVLAFDGISQFRNCFSKDPQPCDSAVRKDIQPQVRIAMRDRKSTRLNSSH